MPFSLKENSVYGFGIFFIFFALVFIISEFSTSKNIPLTYSPQDQLSQVSGADQGRTFYIDYSNGLDTNNGLSKETPWKTHPFMTGFSGSYVHESGDSFLFKGGVVWPRTSFQMNVIAGGSDDSNRDYYGVDREWFSGSTWSRPIFDFENTLINPNGWGSQSAGVLINNASYITFEGIEFVRFRQRLYRPGIDQSDPGYAAASITILGLSSYITIEDSVVRDWSIPTPIPYGYIDGGAGEGGIVAAVWSGGGAGIKILNNEFHQNGSNTRSGMALYLSGEIAYNRFHHLSDVIVGSGNIHDNLVHDIEDATCPQLHENVFYMTGSSNVFNNIVYNTTAAAPVYYLEPSRSSGSGTTLVYNNVAFNTGYAPLSVDIDSGSGTSHIIKVYNNSFKRNGSVVRVVDRNHPLGVLELKNNHFISNSEVMDIPAGTVLSFIQENNITDTIEVANQVGATNENFLKPSTVSLVSTSTKDTGISLANYFDRDVLGTVRPQGLSWDVGAYEMIFVASNPTPVTPTSTPPSNPGTGTPSGGTPATSGGGTPTNTGGSNSGGTPSGGASQTPACTPLTISITKALIPTKLLTLRYGMTSADVKTLQVFLNDKGFTVSTTGPGSKGQETFYFGPATQSALNRYNSAPATNIVSVPCTTTTVPITTTTPTTSTTNRLPSTFRFTKTLPPNTTSTDVKNLQIFLNDSGFTVSTTGPGSKGQETFYFGPATKSAVIRFQEYYKSEVLTPNGLLKGTGLFGPASLKKANGVLGR
jgi:peptidoglycan hydrolase-like protein with peptidoglycan-binding domain